MSNCNARIKALSGWITPAKVVCPKALLQPASGAVTSVRLLSRFTGAIDNGIDHALHINHAALPRLQ
jgi:hypothetical protein